MGLKIPLLQGTTSQHSTLDPQPIYCHRLRLQVRFRRKKFKKTWQGATPGHRTLPLPNFARCDTDTSHPATLSCCTLQHRAISPCHFRLSHPVTQKGCFLPLKSPCASSRRRSAHALNLPSALAAPSGFRGARVCPRSFCPRSFSLRRLHVLPEMSRTPSFQRSPRVPVP